MTWHNTSHHIASNDVTITWPDPGTDIKTSKHFTSKHKTSPPWKGRRLVHSKEMIWASRWSVTMRTFYRQILSVLYSSFPFGNFRPRLVRALLVSNIGKYSIHQQYQDVFFFQLPAACHPNFPCPLQVRLFLQRRLRSWLLQAGVPGPVVYQKTCYRWWFFAAPKKSIDDRQPTENLDENMANKR